MGKLDPSGADSVSLYWRGEVSRNPRPYREESPCLHLIMDVSKEIYDQVPLGSWPHRENDNKRAVEYPVGPKGDSKEQ